MESDAVMLVVRKGHVRVAEVTVAKVTSPAGRRPIQKVGDPFNSLAPGKVPRLRESGEPQTIRDNVGRGREIAALSIVFPRLAILPQPQFIHFPIGAVAVKE